MEDWREERNHRNENQQDFLLSGMANVNETKCFGKSRKEMGGLIKAKCTEKLTPHITMNTSFLGNLVATLCCGDAFLQQRNTRKQSLQ